MKQINFWEQFEKTGSVNDYLNFAACTEEELQEEERKEGGYSGFTTDSDRYGINGDAHW